VLYLASSSALFGLWPGNYEPTLAKAASKVLKKNVAIQSIYAPLCPDSYFWFMDEALEVWNAGRVPLFLWECQPGPYSNGKQSTPCSSLDINVEKGWTDRVLRGEFDKYISEVGDKIAQFLNGPDGVWGTADDRRMYIALSTEMNGNWRPWYGAPSRFVAMYRKMADILRSRIPQDANTKTRLQFIWTINHKDVPEKSKKGGYRAEEFYPGANYVDWVGVDGYNWGHGKDLGWWSPVTVFKSIFARLRKKGRGKPLAVIEVGSSAQPKPGKFDIKKKNKWIMDSFKFFAKSRVKMVIFFNQNKERDWENIGVSSKGDKKMGGYRYFSAWLKGLRNKFFIGSNTKNPRLITDKAFLGK